MTIIKCKMCGGDLVLIPDSTVAECEYCGTRQTVPSADNEKKMTLFNRANRLRFGNEFDKAAGIYEAIVADFPEEAEAYWGLVLCKYGIEYVDDPATAKKIPTCHRSSFDSVMDDSNFEQALENADVSARKVYRAEAKQIEEIRKGIIEVSSKEDPYDIFICYKEIDENSHRTLDSVLAQDIYDALTEKGYRTFFARITLEDKLGQEYEPYIFAALNSAKIMLVVGTDYEYFNAVWVRNEWSRFLHLIASGQKKTLIPCYKNIDAYDMPKEFARLQAQDLGKVGAIQDLLRGIEKLLPKRISKTTKVRVSVSPKSTPNNTDSSVVMGFMDYEQGKHDSAAKIFRQVLMQHSECPEAYLGLLLGCAGKDWNAYRDKFFQYAPQKMSALEKKVFSSKIQDDMIQLYCKLGNPDRFSEALGCYSGSVSNELFIELLLTNPAEAMVRALIARGCDPNAVIRSDAEDGYSENPVLVYLMTGNASSETMEVLLNCGADPNGIRVWHDKAGSTTRYSALSDSIWRHKNLDYAKLLIKYGADVHCWIKEMYSDGDYSEETMIHEAVLDGNLEMVKLLLESGCDPNAKRVVHFKQGNSIFSPLYDAVWKRQDAAMVELLLAHGADPSFQAVTYDNEAYEEITCVSQAVMDNCYDIVKLLLEHNADANAVRLARYGNCDSIYSPLYDAATRYADPALTELLLEHGADPDFAATIREQDDCFEAVPVLCGAVLKDYLNTAEVLLRHGADPNHDRIIEESGTKQSFSTLYDSLFKNNNYSIFELLLAYNADPNRTFIQAFTGEQENGYSESTLLNEAVLLQDGEKLEKLLQCGADPNGMRKVVDGNGESVCTALYDSIWKDKSLKLTKILLSYGADPCAKSKIHHPDYYEEITPLSSAIGRNDYRCAELLLQHGSDPNILRLKKNEENGTNCFSPLGDSISMHMDLSLVRLLLQYGADATRIDSFVYRKSLEYHNAKYIEKHYITKAPILFLTVVVDSGRTKQEMAPLVSKIIALLMENGASLDAIVEYRGVRCPIRRYPFSELKIDDTVMGVLREFGWKGPRFFDKFTLTR